MTRLTEGLEGADSLESTFIDQINPKRQTAGPHEGGSPELDLALNHLTNLKWPRAWLRRTRLFKLLSVAAGYYSPAQ